MSYLNKCSYVESHENDEHTYTFTGPCMVTGELYSVTVKGPDLFRYQRGEHCQNCFPYLSVDDREFIISGTSPKGWIQMFGGFGDDDDDFDDDDFELDLTEDHEVEPAIDSRRYDRIHAEIGDDDTQE